MRKKRNKTKKTIITILLVILFLFSLRVVSFVFFQYKNLIWKNQSNLLIAYAGRESMFAVYSEMQKKVVVVVIPENTKIFGSSFEESYNLNSYVRLGGLENKQMDYYITALNNLFGVQIEAWVQNPGVESHGFDLKLTDIFLNKTNLTIFDYIKIKNKNFKTEIIVLEKKVNHTALNLKGDESLVFSSQDLDEFFKQILTDKFLSENPLTFKIVKEADNFESYNHYKRLIGNIGWKLSDVETEEIKTLGGNTCNVKKSGGLNKTLQKIFNCQVKQDPSINYDVVIYLSEY